MIVRTVLAVDLGAESGRVMAVGFDGRQFSLEPLHRFPNMTTTVRGTLYWDFLGLWGDICHGIEQGKALQPASIAVDTWGVDFGLLDAQGSLLGNPVHYRDGRTEGIMGAAFARVPRAEIFARTGIQFMPINTLYQLLSLVESDSPQLGIAETFLTAPDLLNYWLTGEKVCEFTNATTTQLYDPIAGDWAGDMMGSLGIPRHIFPPIVAPGARLGSYEGMQVITPACHDTGSAVASIPARNTDFAYISSGTWSLVGLEADQPVLTSQALAANVTNEGGVYGTFRILKNVMGLWLLQQCRTTWAAAGETYSYDDLTRMAAEAEPLLSVFNVNDPAFLAPGDHPALIRAQCRRSGQAVPESPAAVVRAVLENLAAAYRQVLEEVTAVAGRAVSVIHIVGGGSRNELLNQMTADVTGLPVIAGPVEATVIGNGLVQLITLGYLADLAEARHVVAGMAELKYYEPRNTAAWDDFYGRYREQQTVSA